jgi:hypothetical protein
MIFVCAVDEHYEWEGQCGVMLFVIQESATVVLALLYNSNLKPRWHA